MNKKITPLQGEEFDTLVEKRLRDFWGYGNLESHVWFIGMEEGVGKNATHEDYLARFRATEDKATVDMRNGMEEYADHMKFFGDNAPIQPTWKYPIALYLYLKNGVLPTKEDIQEHQIHTLGDIEKKETTCIELMPLPSNTIREDSWVYSDLNILNLGTRKEYIEIYKPERVKKLHELVQLHKPKLIIFYSLTYLSDWGEIIDGRLEETTKGMYFSKNEDTAFCIVPQSVSFGMSYERLYEYADKIKEKVNL